MANMRLTYEGLGIHVEDWSFVVVFFMNIELGILFFDKKTMIFSCTYKGIGMLMVNWKIQLLCMGWRNFFPVVLLCQFFGFWWEIGFGVNYLHI